MNAAVVGDAVIKVEGNRKSIQHLDGGTVSEILVREGDEVQAGDVVLLQGELGAGKTCFAQGIGAGLEVREPVKSSSFVLVNEYRGRVAYVVADVFSWASLKPFGAVVFAFWLSHVPPGRFEAFWSTLRGCLVPGGRAVFLDAAIILALISFLGTVAFARYLERRGPR